MKISFRLRLFLAIFAVVLFGVLVAGAYLSSELKTNIQLRVEQELLRQSHVAALYIAETLHRKDVTSGQKLVHRLGGAADFRYTIIHEDGTVLGDTDLTAVEVKDVQNHSNRPEIRAAMKNGDGSSHRYSTTIGFEMFYSATRFSNATLRGVVRVSKPLREVDEALAVLYSSLLVGGLIVLVLSLLLALFFSAYFTRILKSLVSYAQKLAEGKRASAQIHEEFEFTGLTSSLQTLSEKLEESVQDLAVERDRFEAVLEGMGEAVIALDAGKRVTVINSAALMLLELGKEPVGHTLLETIRVPELTELLDSLVPGDNRSAEFEIGVAILRKVLARVVCLHSGAYVIVLMDVTELRRLESVRRDFVSNVSHELRTPISVVRANAETLLDGALEDKEMAGRFLQSIVANSERLSSLIADLLDLARIEEGKWELKKTSLTLSLALRRACSVLETKANDKKQTILVEPCGDIQIAADARAIDQVLFNLLDNAVKYTPEEGLIRVRGYQNGARVIVEVEDNGPGIEEVHRNRLFERFYRVDKGRSREMGGTGLGLAIVKHLTNSMGGDVGMRPAPEGGSIFWVKLPI
ncbi:MAG: PAS domain-containing protein [Deltaproteobacteria bacterium]|nr:PAS domain-containing protein [Deltaproteobacteria bacterium]